MVSPADESKVVEHWSDCRNSNSLLALNLNQRVAIVHGYDTVPESRVSQQPGYFQMVIAAGQRQIHGDDRIGAHFHRSDLEVEDFGDDVGRQICSSSLYRY